MLLHPFGELRGTHQAGLQRDVRKIRSGDDLLVAIAGEERLQSTAETLIMTKLRRGPGHLHH